MAAGNSTSSMEKIEKLIEENPVVVFGPPSCCLCHVAKRLLVVLGVNPVVVEVNYREVENHEMMKKKVIDQYPALFVGGKLIGGLEDLVSLHISGELVPKLKKAGAIWV